MSQCSTSTLKDSCPYTVLDSGVKRNERADRLAGEATITNGGHKAKDITPSIARRREEIGGHKAKDITPSIARRREEIGGHKAKDITPSIARRREAGTKPRTSHHRSTGGEKRVQSQGHHTIDRQESREMTEQISTARRR